MGDWANWFFDKEELKNSPSRADGVSEELENHYRVTMTSLAWHLGGKLKYHLLSIATGMTFSQRFFMRESFKAFDHSIIAATCLFLAGKVEEDSKKLHSVVHGFHALKNPDAPPLDVESEEFFELKESILKHEQMVLHTLSFDVSVDHPYKSLLELVHQIDAFRKGQRPPLAASGLKVKNPVSAKGKKLLDICWNIANDSLRTTLSLQYRGSIIALGTIHLGFKFLKENLVVDGKSWLELVKEEDSSINCTSEMLEDVSHQVLDLYERMENPPKAPAPPVLAPARADAKPATASAAPPGPKTASGAPPPGKALPRAGTVLGRQSTCPPKGTPWEEGAIYKLQGSAPTPYHLKRVGEIYSCTCPVWTVSFAKLPENKRTCNHLKVTRGDAAERLRVGTESMTYLDRVMRGGQAPRPGGGSALRPGPSSSGGAPPSAARPSVHGHGVASGVHSGAAPAPAAASGVEAGKRKLDSPDVGNSFRDGERTVWGDVAPNKRAKEDVPAPSTGVNGGQSAHWAAGAKGAGGGGSGWASTGNGGGWAAGGGGNGGGGKGWG